MSRSTSEERPELDELVQRKLVEKGEHLNRLIQSIFCLIALVLLYKQGIVPDTHGSHKMERHSFPNRGSPGNLQVVGAHDRMRKISREFSSTSEVAESAGFGAGVGVSLRKQTRH